MSQGSSVTYADLKFVKALPEKNHHEEPNEGELTYENIWGPEAQEEVNEEEEEAVAPQPAEDARGWKCWTRYGVLGTLVTSLFLLAATIGLGARYWQVSGQLQRASQDHAAHSSSLARRIDTQEESLAQVKDRLHQARTELNSTRRDLLESRAATERTQKRLQEAEEELRRANLSLDALRSEKEGTEAELRQAGSCQQIGCCPPGWKLFRWKCLWVSREERTWQQSQEDCRKKSSQLVVLKKPWDARELWEAVMRTDFPHANEYWIGLSRTRWREKTANVFLWVDGSRYEGADLPDGYPYSNYIKITHGNLAKDGHWSSHRYICEMAADSTDRTYPPSWL